MMESWGFSIDCSADVVPLLHLTWGKDRNFSLDPPWRWTFYRREVLLKDHTWVDIDWAGPENGFVIKADEPKEPEGAVTYSVASGSLPPGVHLNYATGKVRGLPTTLLYTEKHPYKYCTRYFEIQEVTATVTVNRMILRRKALMWCPWFNRVDTYIEVEFDGEVGEGRGDWKGGCIGCNYLMKDCESPEGTLRRMMHQRRFE